MFNAPVIAEAIPHWIAEYFKENGPAAPCIIGMSGGKDSTITATCCVNALGKQRVIGILMPDGQQKDLQDAKEVCNFLGIKYIEYNIGYITTQQYELMKRLPYRDLKTPNDVVRYNNPARIRMVTLYMIANQLGGRVANTCNMSETYVGYDTAWGDQCGDFAPLQNLTVTELRQLGKALKLPEAFVYKTPHDGMCGRTDEERFGFTYDVLDEYLRGGVILDEIQTVIENMHNRAAFKNSRVKLPSFPYYPLKSRKLFPESDKD